MLTGLFIIGLFDCIFDGGVGFVIPISIRREAILFISSLASCEFLSCLGFLEILPVKHSVRFLID